MDDRKRYGLIICMFITHVNLDFSDRNLSSVSQENFTEFHLMPSRKSYLNILIFFFFFFFFFFYIKSHNILR